MRGCTSDSNFPSSPPDSSPQEFLSQDIYIPYRVQLWKVPPPAFFEFGLEPRCSVKLGSRIRFILCFWRWRRLIPKGKKRGFLSLQPSPLGSLPPSLGERPPASSRGL